MINVRGQRWSQSRRRLVLLSLAGVLLLAGGFLVLLQVSPWYVGLSDDSGLFAYGGQRILAGDLLYRDLWDTKPPGVFYLNAFALALGGETPWAIWWFQQIWIGLSAMTMLAVLTELSGIGAGILSCWLLVFTTLYPDYFQGGNLTEVYALLPQALILAASAAYFRSSRSGWLLVIGLATGFAFVLKPTYIALGAAAALLVGARAFANGGLRKALRPLAFAAAGFLIPIFLIGLYWGAHGALDELWAAVFRQNVQYVQEGLSLRSLYGTARAFLLTQPLAPLTALTVAGLAKFLMERIPRRNLPVGGMLPGFGTGLELPEPGAWKRLVFQTAALALPFEVALVALSGRNFGHYFITPLPAMAVATAYLLKDAFPSRAQLRDIPEWHAVSFSMVVMLLVAWLFTVGSKELPRRAHLTDLVQRPLSGAFWTDQLEQYVVANSSASQSVLVWGYNPGLHFLTGRRAPSRYLFHAQLFTHTAAAELRFDHFLSDLEVDSPALVLAQPESPHAIPFFGAEGDAFCSGCSTAARRQLTDLRELVQRGYELVEQLNGWQIYRLRPGGR